MKFSGGISVLLVCWISVVRADNLLNFAKCERDTENCEQFSFRRTQQNMSNVNKSESKSLSSRALNDLVENQIVLAQAYNQENGNFQAVA